MSSKPRIKIPVHVFVYTIAFLPGAAYGKSRHALLSNLLRDCNHAYYLSSKLETAFDDIAVLVSVSSCD